MWLEHLLFGADADTVGASVRTGLDEYFRSFLSYGGHCRECVKFFEIIFFEYKADEV